MKKKLKKPIKIIIVITILLVMTGVFYGYLISPMDKNDNTMESIFFIMISSL